MSVLLAFQAFGNQAQTLNPGLCLESYPGLLHPLSPEPCPACSVLPAFLASRNKASVFLQPFSLGPLASETVNPALPVCTDLVQPSSNPKPRPVF